MARRLRFDVSRRQLLQSLGLGAAVGPLIPAAQRQRADRDAAQTAAAAVHARRDGGAELQHDRRLEADRHRDRLQLPSDPRAAGSVQGEDRRPLGPDDVRGRRGRGARVRDGGPVDRHDAAPAQRRRELRWRQRQPDRVGRRPRRSIRSSPRRRAEHALPAPGQRRQCPRRAIDRSRSACSAATRPR